MNKDHPPITNESLKRLIEQLEEDIVFGKLHPKERLVEEELMHRFQIKRHVVRDLLTHIERMGLVERRKNIGAFVRSFTPKEVIELYELRTLLEIQAIKSLKFPIDSSAIVQLVELQKSQDLALSENDWRKVFRINLKFHETLFSICENEALKKAIREYAKQTHPIRFISLTKSNLREKSQQEHWSIIQALQENNRDELIRICSEHLVPSRDFYLEINQF